MSDAALTIGQAREAVYQQFKAVWEATYGSPASAPYVFENKYMKEPDPSKVWARVSLRHSTTEQETMGPTGARKYLRNAYVWVQLFGAVNSGVGYLDDYVKTVRKAFEGVSFGGLWPNGAARPYEVGDDGHWYELAVVSPVQYYELV